MIDASQYRLGVLTMTIRPITLKFMDERFDLSAVGFIWNAKKALANLRKHGVSFEEAATVFFDPFLKLVDASPEDEARDAVIGTSEDGRLLFVVHIAFEQELVRIISARKATRNERLCYEE
jgi:uncharacterized DUF497 family protein